MGGLVVVLRLTSWLLCVLAVVEGLRVLGGAVGSRWWLVLILAVTASFIGFWSRAARGYDLQSQIDRLKSH